MKFLKILSSLKVIFVFILLEILALLIIANKSVFQRSHFVQLSMDVSAMMYEKTSELTKYFGLYSTNEELVRHNTELQKKVEHLQNIVSSNEYLASVGHDSAVAFVPAKIVSKTLNDLDNYFILNKGEKDGISEGLGVVCNSNVLGVVQYVSRNYSAVLLAMSAKMKLSGMIKNDGHLCTVIWDKVSTSKAEIEDIPYHIDVKIGDTIVTSGFSSIFPENYVIGTISKITKNKSTASNDLQINYSVDFMRAKYAEIVIPKDINEINKLKEQTNQ